MILVRFSVLDIESDHLISTTRSIVGIINSQLSWRFGHKWRGEKQQGEKREEGKRQPSDGG